MAITLTNLKIYLSGGVGNSDPNLSIGGVRSTTILIDNTLHNLFDKITGDEALAGDTDYRCVYIRQEHLTLTWEAVKLWISQLTTSIHDEFDIGLDPIGKNGIAATIPDEDTAPAGVTFTRPITKPDGLLIGDLLSNDFYPFWVKRTVNAAAAAKDSNDGKIKAEGDSAE